jgi:hypothetical protein
MAKDNDGTTFKEIGSNNLETGNIDKDKEG